MKRIAIAAAVGIGSCVFALPPAAAGTGVDGAAGAACLRELRDAGLLGAAFNPGNLRFTGGTEGDDQITGVPAGTVYCGFGGDDQVTFPGGHIAGIFYGGEGEDIAAYVDEGGRFIGGPGTDTVIWNSGVTEGNEGDDIVVFNYSTGLFDGGAGTDEVTRPDGSSGSCVDVEIGC